MTIKEVLDRFAQEKLVHTAVHGSHIPFSRAQAGEERVRTTVGLCPLQVMNNGGDYIEQAIYDGLPSTQVWGIINWADTGRWPIRYFYPSYRCKQEDPRDVAAS